MASHYTPLGFFLVVSLLAGCCPYGPHRARVGARAASQGESTARGRRISASACEGRLDALGIAYRRYRGARAEGVRRPIILDGPVAGVAVRGRWSEEVHSVVDCRLVLALHDWAPILQRAGVREVQYFSMLRPGARVARTGRRSGHASALAIDVGWFILEDGTELSVLEDWEDRDRGESPCEGRHPEDRASALMRTTVCEAASAGIFQVIITPHHDHAHRNHLHLEVQPGGRGVWLR